MRLRLSLDDGRGDDARRWRVLATRHLQRAVLLYVSLGQLHDEMTHTDAAYAPCVQRARALLNDASYADIAALAEKFEQVE